MNRRFALKDAKTAGRVFGDIIGMTNDILNATKEEGEGLLAIVETAVRPLMTSWKDPCSPTHEEMRLMLRAFLQALDAKIAAKDMSGYDDTLPPPRKPLPTDAVMVIAPPMTDTRKESGIEFLLHQCRDCNAKVAVLPRTIEAAYKDKRRGELPVKFLCDKCFENYETGSLQEMFEFEVAMPT